MASGKTTTTVNVAAALAQAGSTVLVIDLDPQGNASTALGIEHHAEVPSVYDVLVEGKPIAEVVQECPDVPGLFCVPATIDLAGAEIELVSLVARETRLQRAVSAYVDEREAAGERLDYVLIDCPPSLGLLTVNAFVAATEVFIPIQCEYYALEGLSQLLKNIELIRSHLNPPLHVSTILLTMYDGRTRLSAQVADEVREHFPDQTLRASVPRSVRISEAPSHGQTVMTYDPNSSGALSYLEAAVELAERGAADVADHRGVAHEREATRPGPRPGRPHPERHRAPPTGRSTCSSATRTGPAAPGRRRRRSRPRSARLRRRHRRSAGPPPSAEAGTDSGSALRPVPGAEFAEIPLDQIRPNPRQPRTVFDEDELERAGQLDPRDRRAPAGGRPPRAPRTPRTARSATS